MDNLREPLITHQKKPLKAWIWRLCFRWNSWDFLEKQHRMISLEMELEAVITPKKTYFYILLPLPIKSSLVGGFNPFEKYKSKLDHFQLIFGMTIKNPSCITDILCLTNYRSSPPQTPEVSLQFHKSFFFLQTWNFCVRGEQEKKP